MKNTNKKIGLLVTAAILALSVFGIAASQVINQQTILVATTQFNFATTEVVANTSAIPVNISRWGRMEIWAELTDIGSSTDIVTMTISNTFGISTDRFQNPSKAVALIVPLGLGTIGNPVTKTNAFASPDYAGNYWRGYYKLSNPGTFTGTAKIFVKLINDN